MSQLGNGTSDVRPASAEAEAAHGSSMARQRPPIGGEPVISRCFGAVPSAALSPRSGTVDLYIFGQHRFYGNGLPRPLMRGWLHTACLALGLLWLAIPPERSIGGGTVSHWFVGCTLGTRHTFVLIRVCLLFGRRAELELADVVGYCGSANFHMVPYTTPWQSNWALAGDLVGVGIGTLAPILTLYATSSGNILLPRFATDGSALLIGVACLVVLVAMLGSSLAQGRAVMDDSRALRIVILALLLLLQTTVECLCVATQPEPGKLALLGTIAFCKIVTPVYQLKFGSHAAMAKNGLRERWLTFPGVWEVRYESYNPFVLSFSRFVRSISI